MINKLSNFAVLFSNASEKGLLLLTACILAIVMANTTLSETYFSIINTEIIGHINLMHFVNEGLMSVFFFLVGLEIKREMLEGHLATKAQRILPIVAAFGGVMGPVIIYAALNFGDPVAIKGWAVPAATDIAFALGMFALLGRGLPIALRVFLTALAIVDDLIAVIMIALFYSDSISAFYLISATLISAALFLMCYKKYDRILPYILIGSVLWYCVLQSGIHATIAGVVLGMFIPLQNKSGSFSPIKYIEQRLHPIVLFLILPLFAFTNSGVSVGTLSFEMFTNTVSLGIILGLFFGKQIGICLSIFTLKALKIYKDKDSFTIPQFYAVSILCGIGFTMSLFVGNLAFDNNPEMLANMKIGVLSASLLSSVVGGIMIHLIRGKRKDA